MINLFYANAETILSKAGFRVKFLTHKEVEDQRCAPYVVVETGGRTVTAVHSGRLSAVGLNMYLQSHFKDRFEHAAMFSIDGGVGGTVEPGKIAEDFPLAVGDREGGFQRDLHACEAYASCKFEDFKEFDYEAFGDNCPWTYGVKAEPLPMKIMGRTVEYPLPTDRAFYYVTNKPEHVDTVDYLREQGFFCLNKETHCVVTNWSGVKFCLPPNPIVLGNKVLDFDAAAPKATRSTGSWADEPGEGMSRGSGLSAFSGARPVKSGSIAGSESGAGGRGLKTFDYLMGKMGERVERYLRRPGLNSFIDEFTQSGEVKEFMNLAKLERRIKFTSRQKTMIPKVKTFASTVELTWENLISVVEEACNGDKVTALYTLGNIRSQITELDGKPFF